MIRLMACLAGALLIMLPTGLWRDAALAADGCVESQSQADAFYVVLDCTQPVHSQPAAPVGQGPSLSHAQAELAACVALVAATPALIPECLERDPSAAGVDPAQTMNALMLEAVRRVRPPALEVIVQPPGGRTLVNLDTIFLAEAETVTRPVRLLGRRVLLRIIPSQFTWVHGDGSRQVTEEPGRRYEPGLPMRAYITHRYASADATVHPRVDVGYSAKFSLDGGATWREVTGVVNIVGPEGSLRVVEARPVLVGSS